MSEDLYPKVAAEMRAGGAFAHSVIALHALPDAPDVQT